MLALWLLTLAPVPAAAQTPERPRYRDSGVPVPERVRDLLGRMTRTEKFWQLFMIPGDGDDGHAHMHSAERHQRVVDAVLGQDHEGPIRPQLAVEQGLANGICGLGRSLVGEMPPAAGRIALGQENPLRRRCRPALEQHAERARHGPELARRAQHHRAVGAPLMRDLRRCE